MMKYFFTTKKIHYLFPIFLLFFCYAKKPTYYNFASYNLKYDTGTEDPNNWENRKKWLSSQVEYYEFDIIGTQEGLKHQIEDLANIPHYKSIGVAREDGKEKGEYTAIVYNTKKFSVEKQGNFWLSEHPTQPSLGWDAGYKRNCTWALFETIEDQQKFYVFNIHFDNQGQVAQLESAKLILAKIKELAQYKFPIFLMGDFNVLPSSAPIQLIKQSLKDSYEISVKAPFGPYSTFNGFKIDYPKDYRIDYIFTNDKVKVNKYAVLSDIREKRFISDHFPVVIQVSF